MKLNNCIGILFKISSSLIIDILDLINFKRVIFLVFSLTLLSSVVCKKEPGHLYCIGHGVRIRETADVKGKKVGSLSLYEKVTFIRKSEKAQKLRIGTGNYYYPWYQIKNASDITGWVYGVFLHRNIFNKPLQFNNIGISILGWSGDDKVALIKHHDNYVSDTPIYSFHIYDLEANKYIYDGKRQHIEFLEVMGYLNETRDNFNINLEELDYGKYYETHYYKYSLDAFIYKNRYVIHDALAAYQFKPAGLGKLKPLPVKIDGDTIEVKLKRKRHKSDAYGMTAISAYDIYTGKGSGTKKIFSKHYGTEAELIHHVALLGYLTNPLNDHPALLIEVKGVNGYDFNEWQLVGLGPNL